MRPFFNDTDLIIEWRIHALQQMSIRNINRRDVLRIVSSGEIIESYPDDLPYPSFLFMGYVQGRPLHVVIAHEKMPDRIYIVTAYEPDNEKWDENFRRRK